MIKRTVAIFLFASFIYLSASAQPKKLTFHSINTLGAAMGQHSDYILFQTVNGLKYKKWFSGIGFGGDYYQYHSYSLFLDGRKYFGKYCKWFAYGDLGYNFSGKNTPGKEISYYNSYQFSGGVYDDIGIGYRGKITKKTALLFSLGYSYKEMQSKITIVNPCFVAPCTVDYQNYKYGDGRVVLKAGVDF